MKKASILICFLLCAFVIACYDDDIENINERLDAIENIQIASLEEQIKAIDNTLPELKNADKELNEYIAKLQTTATELKEKITAVEDELTNANEELDKAFKEALEEAVKNAEASNDALKTDLIEELKKSQVVIIAQLETAKSELNYELAQINAAIETLQAKDKALEEKITELDEFVNNEIQGNKDWATATFATLEQYNSLAEEIATIKGNINSINNSITALEKKLTESINSEIAKALESVDADIKEVVEEITATYTKLVADTKKEITEAYTQAIDDAIISIETSMKSWVNEQLAGYYTIVQVDAKLAILSDACATKESLQQEVENMSKSIAETKKEVTEAYTQAITDAISTNNGLIDGKIAEAISSVNSKIDNKVATINAKISVIEERLNKVEEDIATINEQITNINSTIENLRNADTELDTYIKRLQATAINLQKAIDDTDKKIDDIEVGLQNEISAAKTELLAELALLKAEMQGELTQIMAAITALQEKDTELEKKIDELQQCVENELRNTRDWATATFSTLEQYNKLADEVAGIKVQIQALNEGLSDLESRINTKISTDIAQAVAKLDADIQQKVSDLTNAYTAAINNTKNEITAAYTSAIELAIFNLELSMQAWVNEKLSNYYTIAQIDAMLSILEDSFNNRLEAQKSYLVGLINNLSVDLNNKITNNKSLIDALLADVNTLTSKDAELATLIANNATAIAKNADEIKTNVEAIANNSGSIANNNSKILENNRLIEANTALIADNSRGIEILSSAVNAKVQEQLDMITRNATGIANNASLIAKNATAINNNAEAVAQNTAEIQQLQTNLATTKEEITEAYKAAIKTAIETLDGGLRNDISNQIEAINTRINNDVESINATIVAIETRLVSLEDEINNIKDAVYEIQQEIKEMHEQIAALINRIQAISFIPEYNDGKATMYYYILDDGSIAPGTATLKYEIRPKSVTQDLLSVWEQVLSVKAVYTKTRAIGEFVSLDIKNVTAEDGVLSIEVSGANLCDEFYNNEISASICMEISDEYNSFITDYLPIIPAELSGVYIPDTNFKAYLVGNFDLDDDKEISYEEASFITAIDCSNKNIKDLTGLETFTNLTRLDCSNNQLSSLDINENNALTYLNISNNSEISTLNLKNNAALTDLYAEGLSIADIDLSNNNAMTNANLRNNPQLETLIVWDACTTTRNDYLHFDMGGKYVLDVVGNHYGYPFEIGQYIPWFNGGIVVEISNENVNGKIMSVLETEASWGERKWTSSESKDNGWENVINVKEAGYYESSPAHVWCGNYGKDDWYLPAINELTNINKRKAALNEKLSTLNFTNLGKFEYWSSTEYGGSQAYASKFQDYAASGSDYKTNKKHVRAILAF